jgi:hypothetical protein
MRPRVPRALLATALLGLVAAPAACGRAAPAPIPTAAPSVSPTTVRHGERPPPAWVQNEVAWLALECGDAHPGECLWTLTRASRAAKLAGRDTAYLTMFGARTRAYVAVVRGHFRPPDDPAQAGDRLYLVVAPGGVYLAHGVTSDGVVRRAGLPAVRSYFPRPPLSAGLWGHTMMAGGPFPGGPSALAGRAVAVYAGTEAAGNPLRTVRSDAGGFFTLDLAPGLYTFRLAGPRSGPVGTPSTVRVTEGRPVAAGVYESVP